MTRKLRILLVNEVHYLNTGYAVYGRNLLQKLYTSQKYDIAELGLYSQFNNPLITNAPWRIYSNLPTNKDEENEYNSDICNQFSAYRLGDVILDFHPDIIISINDHWQYECVVNHPLTQYCHWVVMPAVDSSALQDCLLENLT